MRRSSVIALLLLCGGCARCPLRMFDCVERTCWMCGERYTTWGETSWHECKGAKHGTE